MQDAHAKCLGPGYIIVLFEMPQIAVRALEIIGYTPEEQGIMNFRRITHGSFHPPALAAAFHPVSTLVGYILKLFGGKQGDGDVKIWSRRSYIEHPKLAPATGRSCRPVAGSVSSTKTTNSL
ncbi:hypothetical protein [Streptomyces sp. bgisy084]|uniref:hypothetical protein n=1 Tax=unclassified Streptomyces TaxID=2593676 RepID=UPI003D745D3F